MPNPGTGGSVVTGGRAATRAAGAPATITSAIAAAVLLASAPVWAAPRVQTYAILKDGEPIGTEEVRIEPQGDATRVTVAATTRVKMLFLNFTYDHAREELWRGGRLESMTAKTNDDGTPHTLALARKGAGYALTVDGKTGEEPADALPLTLWTPDVLKHTRLLSVIDGKPYAVRVDTLGSETVQAGGKAVPAQHARISGDVERDLWFAADGTLLKTQFKRSGYDIVYLLK